MEEDDETGAELVWCVLECPSCAVNAAGTRFKAFGMRAVRNRREERGLSAKAVGPQ